jgi:16S rRNA (guanine(966)-N(2))-methyltransferase RsmD
MRIISGKYRRKTINPPKNFKARPTTDMAKESLFNMLQNEFSFEDLKVLDLFAGTGGISYEFASRYCEDITCVELNYNHFSFIKNTIKDLGFEKEIAAIKSNVFVFLRNHGEKYDLIFADPPYDLKEIDSIPELIFKNANLKQEGILIVEHSANTSFTSNKHFYLHKNYGSVNFSFFRND